MFLESRSRMNESAGAPPAPPTHNEKLKAACPTLAGTIAAALVDAAADRFSDDDAEYLKFHGIYQEDDRDQRKQGRQYIFLVRARLPGGVVRPEQYLTFDCLADQYANRTLRITSRQSLQWHGVSKRGLTPVMRRLQESLATTLAACGDVLRNVMAPPGPATSPLFDRLQADARQVSAAFLPLTPAYRQLWAEAGLPASGTTEPFVDPIYGRTYLPRKFKVAFALPPVNDVDVFANCLGFIAMVEDGRLAGYNVTAGGGMGMSHGNPLTYPRLADLVGYVPASRVLEVTRAALTIHRDFGDRTNRRHARLKYVIQEKGLDWFRSEMTRRLGFDLEPARPFQFERADDTLGWHRQHDGNYCLGLYVENGRIRDTESCRLKTALRVVTERFSHEIRLTPSQNLLLANVPEANREPIAELFRQQGVNVAGPVSVLRRAAMACPSLPTCGRALAEAERAFADLLSRLEQVLAELGLAQEAIGLRMTGCPNGCDRSVLAEIGVIGKAPQRYQLHLGGSHTGMRLNQLFKQNVKTEDLAGELRPVLERFARERMAGERFGDFCARVIQPAAPAAN